MPPEPGITHWGLIGLGKIADVRVAPAFAQSATEYLWAVAGRDAERTAAFAARHDATPATIGEILADPEIDAVYIAATNDLHAPYAIAAADAGKHVLCEKPLARTLEEGEAMVAACRAAGVMLGVAFMMRYHPLHQMARRLVAEGAIGRPLQARAQYGFLLKPDRQTWRVDRGVAGGGPLMDVGSHAIDLLCYITGAAVTRVAAFAAQQTTPGDAEDSAVVNLELDTGILAQVNVAFNTGFSRTMLEIHGTEGTLTAEGTLGQVAEGSATLVTAEGAQRLEYTPHDLYQSEIEAFGRAVRGEAPLEIGGEAGLSNLRALLAAYRSSHWGGGVALVDRDPS